MICVAIAKETQYYQHMAAKARSNTITKEDLQEMLDHLFDRIEALLTKHLSEAWFEKMSKKLDKIDIKNDLIHESYMDMMMLIKLHHQKIKELESLLVEDPDMLSS